MKIILFSLLLVIISAQVKHHRCYLGTYKTPEKIITPLRMIPSNLLPDTWGIFIIILIFKKLEWNNVTGVNYLTLSRN